MNDSTHAKRNAFLFGWHIGYYNFVLVTAGNETDATLTQDSRQVLGVVASRVEEYIKYFGIEAHLKNPTSPSDARLLWGNRAQIESTERGGNFTDVLNVRFGRRVLEFYQIGKSLITYAIISGRDEIVLQPVLDNMRSNIRILGKKLLIDENFIDEILLDSGRIVDVAGLEEAMFEGQGAKPPSNAVLINFFFNAGVMQVSGGDSTSVTATGGSQVGAAGRGAHADHSTFQQNSNPASKIDLNQLAAELALLRAEMKKEPATTAEQDSTIGSVAAAEQAALKGDAPGALGHLKSAGKWAFDVATTIGTSVAASALKGALGISGA